MTATLILYTRDGCGLCQTAAAMAAAAGIAVQPIDIAGDIELLTRFRDRIPVLSDPRSGAELGWPFDSEALVRFSGRGHGAETGAPT